MEGNRTTENNQIEGDTRLIQGWGTGLDRRRDGEPCKKAKGNTLLRENFI